MESIWTRECRIPKRNRLERDIETEIAVIGAGMAGVLIALLLQQSGHQVVVLEANRIGSGQTKNTTAKITSQHGLIYQELIQTFGRVKAQQYAQANEAAIRQFRALVDEKKIDCDFVNTDAYVYGDDLGKLKQEAEAAASLGLPASFTGDLPECIPSRGAVRFGNQAQFHPLKFLRAASEGLDIYENTCVKRVDDTALITDCGTVRAQRVVFACHYPFVNFPGLYFARMHQERSYVLALENAPQLGGMFIGAAGKGYSFRNAGNLLLLGGEGHRTGENTGGGRYEALRRWARERFPDSREVACWSAQDCVTPDQVPYIGQYAAGKPEWYVTTGFQKWGMTSSMVSAMILRDLLNGEESPYGAVFDPLRFEAEAIPGIAEETGQAIKGLTRRIFQVPRETAEQIPAGHGGVVLLDGEKVGVYKDEREDIYAVDIRCPHLGCQLEWNPDERSWDCPCHGSRFDYQGQLISGPAQENLKGE